MKTKPKSQVQMMYKFCLVNNKQDILLGAVGTKTNCCPSSGTAMLGKAQGKRGHIKHL